jgi:hypothetical protein
MSPDPDPGRERTPDSGASIDDDRIVEAIRTAPQPVVNTRYLVLELDVPFEELLDRLEALVEEGRLEHLEVAGEGHLWNLSVEEELEW